MASGVDCAASMRALGEERMGLRVAVRRPHQAVGSRLSDLRGSDVVSPRAVSPFAAGRVSRGHSAIQQPVSRSRSGAKASASPMSEEPAAGPRCAWPRNGTPPKSASPPAVSSAPSSPVSILNDEATSTVSSAPSSPRSPAVRSNIASAARGVFSMFQAVERLKDESARAVDFVAASGFSPTNALSVVEKPAKELLKSTPFSAFWQSRTGTTVLEPPSESLTMVPLSPPGALSPTVSSPAVLDSPTPRCEWPRAAVAAPAMEPVPAPVAGPRCDWPRALAPALAVAPAAVETLPTGPRCAWPREEKVLSSAASPTTRSTVNVSSATLLRPSVFEGQAVSDAPRCAFPRASAAAATTSPHPTIATLTPAGPASPWPKKSVAATSVTPSTPITTQLSSPVAGPASPWPKKSLSGVTVQPSIPVPIQFVSTVSESIVPHGPASPWPKRGVSVQPAAALPDMAPVTMAIDTEPVAASGASSAWPRASVTARTVSRVSAKTVTRVQAQTVVRVQARTVSRVSAATSLATSAGEIQHARCEWPRNGAALPQPIGIPALPLREEVAPAKIRGPESVDSWQWIWNAITSRGDVDAVKAATDISTDRQLSPSKRTQAKAATRAMVRARALLRRNSLLGGGSNKQKAGEGSDFNLIAAVLERASDVSTAVTTKARELVKRK